MKISKRAEGGKEDKRRIKNTKKGGKTKNRNIKQ
jgi:hypothetical protein